MRLEQFLLSSPDHYPLARQLLEQVMLNPGIWIRAPSQVGIMSCVCVCVCVFMKNG
jgi:hypothetical protein